MKENISLKTLNLIYLIILTVVIALGLYCYCHKPAIIKHIHSADATQKVELWAEPVAKKTLIQKSKYIGYITPINQVELVPNIDGYIQKIWVKGGQNVRIGQPLLMLDDKTYKANYKAMLSASAKAMAVLDNAKLYYHRLKKAGPKAVSKTLLDDAKAKYLAAKAEVSQALANAKKAKVLLGYTMLRSSINGVVGNMALTRGNYVSPQSEALISIVQYNPIRVVFSINNKEYLAQKDQLGKNTKIKLKLANDKIYSHLGKFAFTDNKLDTNSNSIAIYADFANPRKELIANAYVDVILEKEYKNNFVIAQKYAKFDKKGIYVEVIENGKVSPVYLDIIARIDNDYVVANSFKSSQYIVTQELPRLSPNATIVPKLRLAKGGE